MTDAGDRQARLAALDPSSSFIVQAPAGSGKTELLTQRYLALLATVDAPEEILAMTFTRKAAGEMRQRILQALERAADESEPEAGHEALTWKLARAARARAEAADWHLDKSPARLRVMTIDALHAMLSRQMPILSGAGGTLGVSPRPSLLYELAARQTLVRLGEPTPAGRASRDLLRHLDNRFERAEAMLATLLARRDQWLSRVTGPGAMDEGQRRGWLEGSLRRQITDELISLRRSFDDTFAAELPALAALAGKTLSEKKPDSPIAACAGMTQLPAVDESDMARWLGLAELCLTRAGQWRKRATAAIGLPAGTPEQAAMNAWLETLADQDSLRGKLHQTRDLPPWRYDAQQWDILGCLLTLLPTTAAELELVMRERGEVDYVAVAHAARRALGDDDDPTDLALALDYRIRHILLDEFQDTSSGQVQLLQRLTAGWEQGDGRSLFCVGDPMQSIYAFREAEVGLFLQVRRQGRVSDVAIRDLVLERNFRSDRGLVAWVNDAMRTVMPASEDPRLGAVTFAPALASRDDGPRPPVVFHAFTGDSAAAAEADRVVETLLSLRQSLPDRAGEPVPDIAVLVRARGHLSEIVPRLRAAGIPYKAVDIEPLAQRPVIQDLMALTRAVVHLGDRTAWLAVMRAPWCGLALDDMERVSGDPARTVWESISQTVPSPVLDADAARRFDRLCQVLGKTLDERGRRPLYRLVEGAWLALGGPAALTRASDLDDARTYLQRLQTLETAGDLDDVATLESRLDDLFAAPDPAAADAVQLMTIHKAKGLQFDYVLLPGLQRTTAAGESQLLHWLEFSRPDGTSDLLLGTVEERGAERDPLHRFLKKLEARKASFELGRLLYVAVTRARHQLHLFGTLALEEDEEGAEVKPPAAGSMLGLLWPGQGGHFVDALERTESSAATAPVGSAPCLWRLASDWTAPPVPDPLVWRPAGVPEAPDEASVEFWWAGRAGRAVGTVVHRWFERIAADGAEKWTTARIAGLRSSLRRALAEHGIDGALLDDAVHRVETALCNTLEDERGRWILSAAHEDAHSELAVAGEIDGAAAHLSIDRCFRDETGRRWIIDFKTGAHEGADLGAFLDREVERYRPQLERYAGLIRLLHPGEPLEVGLYFPLHRAWRSWEPAQASE